MSEGHKYYKLEHRINTIKQVAEIGDSDVIRCGIVSLNEIVGIKKGYPIFLGGAPHAGKTEFGKQMMMNLAQKFNWKWFCYLGEEGTIEAAYLDLMHKYLGKPYQWATEAEKVRAEYFINEHFIIANDDLDYMVTGFYDAAAECEREFGITFDGTFFDPFNDLEEELVRFNGREDKFLAYALKQVRVSSKKNKRVDMVVNHIADIKAIQDKDSGQFYMRAALPNEWSGGRTWWRRAFLMLLVYRPPTFLKDENGRPYEENETLIYCQKAKPKGIAKLGRRSIFWDWKKNQFYSYDGGQVYGMNEGMEYKPNTIQPAKDWTESNKNEDIDVPF